MDYQHTSVPQDNNFRPASNSHEIIHGHSGNFLLHGGKLEMVTGDDKNRPAAGMTSEQLHPQFVI